MGYATEEREKQGGASAVEAARAEARQAQASRSGRSGPRRCQPRTKPEIMRGLAAEGETAKFGKDP